MKQKVMQMIGGLMLISSIPFINIINSNQRHNIQNSNFKFLNPEDKIINFEIGTNFSGVLIENENGMQEVWTWGKNESGQLGIGNNINSNVPIKVDTSKVLDEPQDKISDFIISGKNGLLMVQNNDQSQELWLWGYNFYGQLGNGTNENSNVPIKVDTSKMLSNESDRIINLSLANDYVGAIVQKANNKSQIWMWGNNNHYYQLEDGSYKDTNTPTKTNFQVALDKKNDQIVKLKTTYQGSTFMVQNADGSQELWRWGYEYNDCGVGVATSSAIKVNLFKPLNNPNDKILDFGLFWILVQDYETNQQQLWTYGENAYGQLGNGTNTDSWDEFVKVDTSKMLNDKDDQIVNVQFNDFSFSVVVLTKNNQYAVWMWGNNNWGQLGNGTNENSNIPTKVDTSMMLYETNDQLIDLSLGNNNTGALIQNPDGTQELWMWGYNNNQFGNDTIENANVPTLIITSKEIVVDWVINLSYNEQLNIFFGAFALSKKVDTVEIIHTNGQANTSIIPQYDSSTNLYTFFAKPLTKTNGKYYGIETFRIKINGIIVDTKEWLLTNFNSHKIILNSSLIYLSKDTAIIKLKIDKKIFKAAKKLNFTFSIKINEKTNNISYEDIESGDIALINLKSKTNYEVTFLAIDSYGNSYINSSISFETK